MAELCGACQGEVAGPTGHATLARYMDDSLMGHTIYECGQCGERWIRRLGFSGDYAWVRYSRQFAGRVR